MSYVDKRKFTFGKDMVVQGKNHPKYLQPIKPGVPHPNQKPVLDVTRKFSKGTTVDGSYVSGRGGESFSFTSDGGMMANGTKLTEMITYRIPNFNAVAEQHKALASIPEKEPVETNKNDPTPNETIIHAPGSGPNKIIKGLPVAAIGFSVVAIIIGVVVYKSIK